MKSNLEQVSIAWHRNGMGGEPFYVVLFRDLDVEAPEDWTPVPWGWEPPLMVGIVFATIAQVAVLDVAETMNGNIDFAKGNSWRGDDYEEALRLMISAYEEGR